MVGGPDLVATAFEPPITRISRIQLQLLRVQGRSGTSVTCQNPDSIRAIRVSARFPIPGEQTLRSS